MEFAKYYNATELMKKMIADKKLDYKDDEYIGFYVCMDTHDFWVCRVIKDMNEEYVRQDGAYLIERNKIDKFDFVKHYCEKIKLVNTYFNRTSRDNFIGKIDTLDVIKEVMIMDDENGLENWDAIQTHSMEDAIEIIDDGFGIIELEI